jgi:NAD(P)-dependent dehydrogenase (short-subunit alcohol dehydrogenase family)
VILTAREQEWLDMVARDIVHRGGRAIAVAGDITDLEMVEEVVESALGRFDRIDIVVNAAGIVWPLGAAVDTDPEEWAYGIHTNLIGPFYFVNNVLPIMIDQGYGKIVNLTCGSGRAPALGESALRAAKAGLETWTHSVASELLGSGVVIACLDPGIVDTGTRREVLEMDLDDDTVDLTAWLPTAGADELCSPADAAQMVLSLLNDMKENRPGHIYGLSNRVLGP